MTPACNGLSRENSEAREDAQDHEGSERRGGLYGGRMEAENLVELKTLFSSEASGRRITLALKELTLVDQAAVSFLMRCEADIERNSTTKGEGSTHDTSGQREEKRDFGASHGPSESRAENGSADRTLTHDEIRLRAYEVYLGSVTGSQAMSSTIGCKPSSSVRRLQIERHKAVMSESSRE